MNTGGVYGGGCGTNGICSLSPNQSLGRLGPSTNPYDRTYTILLDFLLGNILRTERTYGNNSVEGKGLDSI